MHSRVGMLPSQYTHLSMFSGIGVVGHTCTYIRRSCLTDGQQICTGILICCPPLVYQKLGYIEMVGRAAEMSMYASVEVQALPEYSTKGEVRVQMTAN